METDIMRKELQNMIANGDDELIADLYDIAKEYNDNFRLSDEEMKELDKRRERYLSGESKSSTWEEAKQAIRQNRKVK